MGGLGGRINNCFLCSCSQDEMMDEENIKEGFKINRNHKDIVTMAEKLRINPKGRKHEEMRNEAKGVRQQPLMEFDPRMCAFDALHCLLSFGRLFIGLVCRENAHINTWNISKLFIHFLRLVRKTSTTIN